MTGSEFLDLLRSGAFDREVVIDQSSGQIRQAGADPGPEDEFVRTFRRQAEASLYVFTKGVLGRDYLTPTFHKPGCDWLQQVPPRRKLLMWPREHAKTSIVSHGMPLHIMIQPAEANIYFPGLGIDGSEVPMLLGCETESRAGDHIRVAQTALETNEVLRALWPHRVWEGNPRKQAKKWNATELIIPRKTEFPDPTLRGVGAGQAIAGMHPLVFLKDDLISFEAANSPLVMQTAIDWHIASRGLINKDECLEFILGTHWAAYDLYRYIEENDPTVEIVKRAVIENGRPIYPEVFSMEKIDRYRGEYGSLFPLLFMNNPVDPALADFDIEEVREFTLSADGTELRFEADERDAMLAERAERSRRRGESLLPAPASLRGQRLTAEVAKQLLSRGVSVVGG